MTKFALAALAALTCMQVACVESRKELTAEEKAKLQAYVVSEVPADASVVVFLGGMRAVRDIDDAVAVNREAFRAARAVSARFATEGGVLVTVQDTGGDFGLHGGAETRAWLGGVSALARTAALEWPAASVKAIDLERGGRSAEEIAAAIASTLGKPADSSRPVKGPSRPVTRSTGASRWRIARSASRATSSAPGPWARPPGHENPGQN